MCIFLAIKQPTKTIYVKVDGSSTTRTRKDIIIGVHERLVDFVHDKGYRCVKIAPNKWDYNIETGLSYELDTHKELNTFIKNNTKLKKHRTYAI